MWVRASAAPRRRGGGGRRVFTMRAAAESGIRTPGWRAVGVSAWERRSRPGGWARWPRHVPRERVRRASLGGLPIAGHGHPLRLPSAPFWKWL